MLKVIEDPAPLTIPMCELEPLQVARIHEPDTPENGHIVMRTASPVHFEVFNLTEPGARSCWSANSRSDGPTLEVVLLPPGEVVTLELSNN